MLVWVFALVIAPLALASVFIHQQGKRLVREQILGGLTAAADNVEAQLLLLLEAKAGHVLDFSSCEFIHDTLRQLNREPPRADPAAASAQAGLAALREHLIRHKTILDPDITGIWMFGKEGNLLVSTDDSPAHRPAPPAHLLQRAGGVLFQPDQNAGSGNPAYYKGRMWTVEGRVPSQGVAFQPAQHAGPGNPAYKDRVRGVEGRVPSHGVVFQPVAGEGDRRRFGLAAPAVDAESGERLGSMVVQFKAAPLDDILAGHSVNRLGAKTVFGALGAHVTAYVVDQSQRIIAGPAELLGRRANAELVRRSLAERDELVAEYVGLNGDLRLGATMYLREPGWVVLASVPAAVAYAPLKKLALASGSILLAGIVVVTAGAVVLANRLARPLTAMTRAAERIAAGLPAQAGQWQERVWVNDQHGELARLANAFNAMVEKLHQAFSALKGSEKRFRSLIENASDLITTVDGNGVFGYVSPSVERHFGYTPRELLGKPAFEFVHPDDAARLTQTLGAASQHPGTTHAAVLRFRHKDGSWRFLESIGQKTGDETGDGDIVINSREITERLQLQQALQVRTDQLQSIADTMLAFLRDGDWRQASARLLSSALKQTSSEYGFVGVLVAGPKLRTLAIEGVKWHPQVNRQFYENAVREFEAAGCLEFTNFDNLYGQVLTTGQVVIANDPANDPRSGGRPPGHPPLHHFLGVPVLVENKVVGMIGVANRPGGYTGEEQAQIEILCHAVGVLYDSYRRREHEAALEAERQRAQVREQNRSQILEALGSGEALAPILERIARFVEADDPASLCSILLLDKEGKRLLHGAAPSLPDFYNQAVHGLQVGEGIGSCGTAAFTGKRVIVEDVLTHPYWSPYHELTQKAGVRACWSQPFFSGTGQILGTFAMYHREPRSPTDADIKRIESAASFARLAVERKRADEALRQANDRLETASLAARVALWEWDIPSGSVEWSAVVDSLLGYEDGTFPRTIQAWEELIHPEDRPHVMQMLERHLEQGTPYDTEYRVRRRDGSYVWWQDSGSCRRNNEGQACQMSGACTDITGRKQAEETMARLSQQNELILNSAGEGILGLDLEGNHTFVNPAAAHMLGYEIGELVGQHSHSTWHHTKPDGSPYPIEECPIYAAFKDGVVHHASDEMFWRKDGTGFHVEFVSTPIHEQGKLVGAVVTFTDITERRRAEAEIRRLNQGLERRVRERTADLEAANQELESFTYTVSHDLRAPLRAVGGFSRILLEEHAPALSPEGQRYLRLVHANSRQMGQLVDDLLAFCRLGRQALRKQMVDSRAVVERCLEELGEEQKGRQIAVAVNGLPALEADAAMLKQVWLNLLSNALKYTRPRPQPRIEIGSQGQNGKTVFYVRDNGVGFDMKYADKLFGVFQRLHRAEEFEGTGVGLALVKRIVERHGGRVWAEAQVNQGATFYFTLPGDPSHA